MGMLIQAYITCFLQLHPACMVVHVLGHGQCSFDSFFIGVKSEPSIFPMKQKIQKNKYNIIKCFFKTRKPTYEYDRHENKLLFYDTSYLPCLK